MAGLCVSFLWLSYRNQDPPPLARAQVRQKYVDSVVVEIRLYDGSRAVEIQPRIGVMQGVYTSQPLVILCSSSFP